VPRVPPSMRTSSLPRGRPVRRGPPARLALRERAGLDLRKPRRAAPLRQGGLLVTVHGARAPIPQRRACMRRKGQGPCSYPRAAWPRSFNGDLEGEGGRLALRRRSAARAPLSKASFRTSTETSRLNGAAPRDPRTGLAPDVAEAPRALSSWPEPRELPRLLVLPTGDRAGWGRRRRDSARVTPVSLRIDTQDP
jgi:hypothetical protein